MSHTLSCLSTTILDTFPITQLLGSFGQLVSTSKVGYFTPLESCAAALRPSIRGPRPAAIKSDTKTKFASQFLFFNIAFFLSDCGVARLTRGPDRYRRRRDCISTAPRNASFLLRRYSPDSVKLCDSFCIFYLQNELSISTECLHF